MSKRKIILISAAIGAILLALFGGLIVSNFINTKPEPTPSPTPTVDASTAPIPIPTATPGPDQFLEGYDLTDFLESEQYEQGITSPMGEFIEQIDTGDLDPAIAQFSMSTMQRYIENSVANPYFVSNFWTSQDERRADSLEVYLTSLMDEELEKTFLEPAENPEGEAFQEYYSARLHLLSEGLEPAVSCQESFGEETCFFEPYEVQDFTLNQVEGSDSEVEGTVTVKVLPLYQKPDSVLGDTVYEDRTYTFTFTMKLNDEETTAKLDEKPIMELTALSGSLVTGQLTDYQVFGMTGE